MPKRLVVPDSNADPNNLRNPGRRRFLALAGGTLAAAVATSLGEPSKAWADATFPDNPFKLGVASGEPHPDGVVLWTRLALKPTEADGKGGMPERTIPVRWQVAEDERFRRIVRSGLSNATPQLAHSVHVELHGLRPDREYFYRFRAGDYISPIGRTKTAPPYGARLNALSFAFVSCQNFAEGHYTVLKHLAQDHLDFVIHLGDYIYESGAQGTIGRGHLPAAEVFSLADYRVRHGQYKTDADLQAAHAAFPWLASETAADFLESTIDYLERLAEGGPVLEFAIGTGRVGVPLAERGVPVTGIELSEPMVAQLRRKVDAEKLPVVVGDMATTTVPGAGEFSLVYLVFNTISNLRTQAEQVQCFRNAAHHLRPGGRFLIELWVPPIQRLTPGHTAVPMKVTEGHLTFDTYDLVTQECASHHYHRDADGSVRHGAGNFRYIWPSECDLMAQLADLEFESRFADWKGSPFTAESESHISTWRKS